MKILINSSNKQRDEWINLIGVEENDNAFRMVKNGRDWFQHHKHGTHLIEIQRNREHAMRWYVKITAEFAKRLLKMETEHAINTMEKYVYTTF